MTEATSTAEKVLAEPQAAENRWHPQTAPKAAAIEGLPRPVAPEQKPNHYPPRFLSW